MPPVANSPLLAALRLGTSEAHAQLEAEIDIPKICQDAEAYKRLIKAFWGYYKPFEEVLRREGNWGAAGFSWEERSKLELLQRDLSALGVTEAEITTLPKCQDLPSPHSLAAAFGCVYVLEGSTLGGRHITGILEQSGIFPEARHFFASYGSQVGEMWKDFCEILGRLELDEAGTADALAGASETFSTIGRWLKSCR